MSTFFVDQTGGNDGNDGTSSGAAWKTLSKVFTASTGFAGDDSILFKRGEIWREKFSFQKAGTAGHPITYDAYGTGADPIFNGSDVVTGWTNTSGNVWQKTIATTYQVFFDSARGTQQASQGALASDNDWFWDSGTTTLYIYSTANPSGKTIEATLRHAAEINGAYHYNNINNIHTTKGRYGQSWLGGVSHINITNCTSDWNLFDGISVGDGGTSFFVITNQLSHDNGYLNQSFASSGVSFHDNGSVANHLVTGGTFYNHLAQYGCGVSVETGNNIEVTQTLCYNNFYNIAAKNGTTDATYIHHNICHDSVSFGIDIDTGPTNSRVEHNTVYNAGSHSIALEVTQGGTCSWNIVYNGPGAGAGIECNEAGNFTVAYNIVIGHPDGITVYLAAASNDLIYNNTIYNCVNGITIQAATGCVIKNNIIDIIPTDAFYLNVDNVTAGDFISENNFFGHIGGGFLRMFNCLTKSLTTWKSTTGHDLNSSSGDPLFVNPAARDMRLLTGSSCKNAGVYVGINQDFNGLYVPQGSAPDVGAIELLSSVVYPAFGACA